MRDLESAGSGDPDPPVPAGAQISFLDAARWSRLTQDASPEVFAACWLDLQCELVGAVERGVVVLGPADRGPFVPLARWPAEDAGSPVLAAAAELAMAERRGVVREARHSAGEPEVEAIAYPLLVANRLCGVSALEIQRRTPAELRYAMRQLQWGSAWLEVLVWRRGSVERERLVAVLELIAVCLEQPRFQGAATAAATELATRFDCDRVSFGFRRGEHTRVRALSHSADFSKKTNLVRAIGLAMDEAGDQQAPVLYPKPPAGPPLVIRAHHELSRQHGADAICSLPLSDGDRLLGGLTLERCGGEAFGSDEVELCEHIASLLGPILEAKRREDRSVLETIRETLAAQLETLTGPGHTARKLGLPIGAALLLLIVFAKGEYRVTADAVLEGTVQRTVSAPVAGYIAEEHARAGDVVSEGELLAALDDKDLQLEQMRWESQRYGRVREHRQALADADRARVRILSAQIEEADAQLELLAEQLARTRIKAPFDGIVVTGDLSQSLGAPVERGETLFEIAPLDSYRVILQVDERDVSEVVVGQKGQLALAGLVEQPLPLVIEKITPVSTPEEGRNYFNVEARLEESLESLRPGMQGVGKIEIGTRKQIWIHTHKLLQWWRMWLWSWTP